jgi:hypothetical protein
MPAVSPALSKYSLTISKKEDSLATLKAYLEELAKEIDFAIFVKSMGCEDIIVVS